MDEQLSDTGLTALFLGIPDVALAYLFGSRVDGSVGPLSDYDFAVLVERGRDALPLRSELAHALACELETQQVDVVFLNRAPVELAYAVISTGRLLYERDTATRVEFEAGVLSRYGDYLPVLRAQRREILKGDERGARVRRHRAALRRTGRASGETAATP